MRRIGETLAVAGLAAGALVGCGDQGVEQDAQVVGFARAVDAEIVRDRWVHYENDDHVRDGTVRDVQEDREQDGCREVGDEFFSLNMDDPSCLFTMCESGEGTHCEPRYKTVYDYDRLEEFVIEACPAPIRQMEFKSETPFIDEACIARRGDGERVNRLSRFVIWVRTANPDYEAERPDDEPATLTASHDITAEQWQTVDRDTDVSVRVRDGRITSVEVG